MSVVVNITSAAERRRDPYEGIHGQHARRMLELFQKGARLYVWRGTTPHNWWLETAEGVTHTVAGDRETNGILGVAHLDTPRILKRIGRRVFSSPDRIAPHPAHRDGGKLYKEGWEFDAHRVNTLAAEWAEVQQAVHARKCRPPVFRPNLSVLSEKALALVRFLKAVGAIYPYPELLEPLAELDGQGFLLMNERGEFHLEPKVDGLTLPAGQMLKLRFVTVVH